jgi:predicted AAA+ superfamily ATPase
VKAGLSGYVLREYKAYYKAARYLSEMQDVLRTPGYEPPHLPDEATALNRIDTVGWLNLIHRRWSEIFYNKLKQVERSYVNELIDARHRWAHDQEFDLDSAFRVADTAERLLRAVGASSQAEAAGQISNELLRRRAQASEAQPEKAKPSRKDGKKPLPSWREVILPHPDVASGRYTQAEFAANLADVVQDRAAPEYGDPREFFRRTYLTEGLAELLAAGIKRLTGQGGEPVIQLQTNFGGGKTHSMLALYHLCSGTIGLSDIPYSKAIADRLGAPFERLQARRAVIVGTAFDVNRPQEHDDCTVRTLWGSIAYQLGGIEAYRLVEEADLNGTSPGSDTLVRLLETYAPALIIIDELVAFARNLYGVDRRLSAGTFDSVMTFIQALTEAVKRSERSILLISIPESDIEIGGAGGQAARERLVNVIGRLEAIWKPITATESYEVVRRRLFSSEMNVEKREQVITAFYHLYANHKSDFPAGTAEQDYLRLMRATYPLHPELFARLYNEWSTLERFQRTRGVLRFMAAVIHELWAAGDASPMIMPASLPLHVPAVRNELLRYLPESWAAVIDSDVDGEQAKPQQLDRAVPTLGEWSASRRVARAVFFGSAPSVAAQRVRGLEENYIHLAVAQPGAPLSVYSDALRRMSDTLNYLYTDGKRYWYDTRPTLNRLAQDRAQALQYEKVLEEAADRLRGVPYRGILPAVPHIMPRSSSDVPDEDRFQVVVFGLQHGHRRNANSSDAQQRAKEFLENRGNLPRLSRNMLAFIAPDATQVRALEEALREYLAWRSIKDDSQLNLDRYQSQQVDESLKRAEETVRARLLETYTWLIVPTQPEPAQSIQFEAYSISGGGKDSNFYRRAADRLSSDELLIQRWSPQNLLEELDKYLWRDQPHVGLQQLWSYLAQYCYLPRLRDQNVLQETIRQGVANSVFGYARAVREDGKYEGLVLGGSPDIHFDAQSVIVRAEVARAQLEAMRPKPSTPSDTSSSAGSLTTKPSGEGGIVDPLPPPPPSPSLPKMRYYGIVDLDPRCMSDQAQQIAEEIVSLLTNLSDVDVTITLTIDAVRPDGFDEKTMRDIRENSRTLNFKSYGFTD